VFKKKRFEPSFALGLALQSDEVMKRVEISAEDFQKIYCRSDDCVPKELQMVGIKLPLLEMG
jgi:NOL1/NOP2/fmu family ribosome biogenesis protein